MAKHTFTKSGVALLCAVAGGYQEVDLGRNCTVSPICADDASIKDFAESDSGETSLVFSTSKTFGLLNQEFTA